MSKPRIGVLALQGAFAEHIVRLDALGAQAFEIRQVRDLDAGYDALVLPGGESSVMGKLLESLALITPIRQAISSGTPVLGTCAGLILLAKHAQGRTAPAIAAMDITAVRNAYGRQLGSFCAKDTFDGRTIPMAFIRAPYIAQAGAGVDILAKVQDRIVAARQGGMLVTSFHPELTEDNTVYQYFLSMLPV